MVGGSKRGNRGGRYGTLIFIVPTLEIVAIVILALLSGAGSTSGTLVVDAQSSGKYYPPISLNATVTVNTQKGITPLTLSLSQGDYTVTFSSKAWFTGPGPRTVTVPAGKTSYVVGTYDPVVKFVSVGGGHFNTSSLSAMHGVTPVVWLNPSSDYQFIQSQETGKVAIPPMQNFSYVFPHAGTFAFFFPITGGTVLNVRAV